MGNWGRFAACVVIGIILMTADPAWSSEDPNAEPGAVGMIGTVACLASFVFLFLAIFVKSKDENKQVIVVQQQPPQQVIQVQQPMVQQPQPQYRSPPPQPQYRSPPPPAREAAKTQSSATLRKQAHLERGHDLEMDGDLEGAILAYELAEDFKEAQRVRWALGASKEEGGNGPSNVNISIGKVGDTSVKDSVITGSNDEI